MTKRGVKGDLSKGGSSKAQQQPRPNFAPRKPAGGSPAPSSSSRPPKKG
jgi:hypothetical protein